ncbi:callose synthase [Plasmopara halstedii]|uniref:1,3-beta-glucan synthase n=1 Tax=Plasmopara halstedii TaxID=4781 RepID=A0A0P1B2X0_PLAHL|nr:callose synthase [Plasmopara halstedii]CEG48640.1 callose synthase [Plasmopara halstedii]|eukprot:XP_024585009.1 callose synthase [Plasmopara halstedii]
MAQRGPSGHGETDRRRRASSNYFELDADRRRNKSERSERFSKRLSTMEMTPSSTKGTAQDDEIAVDYCCEFLRAKFGFQEGSVSNQREHVLLLLANGKARCQSTDAADHHLLQLANKLFMNYHSWCKFLHATPVTYTGNNVPNSTSAGNLYMDVMLYFLIWGEAANARLLPECLCYLFHQMLTMVNADPQGNEQQPEGWYLDQVIRPIWREASNMKRRNALGMPLEHVKIRNYDDINEYFWKAHCLSIPVTQVGQELTQNHGKTFYEHRSIFTMVLNYYRIFQFQMMLLVLLTVLAFAVTISPDGGQGGWAQFGSIGDVVAPYSTRDLRVAIVAVPFSLSLMAFFKCVMEVCHGWHLLVSKESSTTSSRSLTYGMALGTRIIWNGGFAILFAIMIYVPLNEDRDTMLLDNLYTLCGAYILPGVLILLTQAFAPQLINSTFAVKFVREGESCYVGQDMMPPLSYKIKYITFWIGLWIIESITAYVILVRPLILPTLSIYDMHLDYQNSLVSFHNIGIIVALWLPVVCIFNYSTQIFFTIFQALLGGFQGILMKTGEIHGGKEMTKAFRVAPQLFDQKVVTLLARSSDAPTSSMDNVRASAVAAAYESQMMLRFVVVWNEIVNSFRVGDLLDDKEAAVLQYDIRSTGEVFEPVFLSAGKLTEAVGLVIKAAKEGKGESQLRVTLVENDCLSANRSFFTASMYVISALFGTDDADVVDGFRMMEELAANGGFLKSFNVRELATLRLATVDLLEEILDLPDPDVQSQHIPNTQVHSMGVIRNFVAKMETFLNHVQSFCVDPALQRKFSNSKFCTSANGYMYASRGLVNLFCSDTAMGAATRACLLLSLDRSEAMPRTMEAQRRLGFFMKSLVMDIPQLRSIKEMRSFSVVTPFYAETVLFSLKDLNDPLVNHPIFQQVEEDGKNLTILKYLTKIHQEEWDNFLERVDVSSAEEAQKKYPEEIRLWASYRGQTLARTVQGMMMYEDAIKILHWLEIGSSPGKTPEQKQSQLQDMVRLKFSYVCACQVYGKHRLEGKAQAADIDYLLREYPNLRVAYVDTVECNGDKIFDTVLIKSEADEIVEVYRYSLPGDPVLGEGKPENQNNALPFTRGEFVQTIDMNQQHYFEECLKMPQLLCTADLHPSKKPVSIIGMREHIFTGNASSLAKFKTWQELVFVTLSQRVLADPLCVRMHYGHPDVFDKVLAITRGGVSKASKGINLSEDVFAGFNTTLRGGVVTHVEFMQCGKGRDVALSQISMFEGKLGNGAGETSLSREAHRMGQFMDFFRLNSMFYAHTGFFYATWMTIVTTFVYMYCKVYIALSGVQSQIVYNLNSTEVIMGNSETYGFDNRVFEDMDSVYNTQYYIQAGLFLSLPLICVYFAEMGVLRGLVQFLEMVFTLGPVFFIFQLGTTMHFFDNNLLHGEASYKATGRGFKITRETFVLLYKAYASSHYRKAMELIGLCLVYLAFGAFEICDTSVAGEENSLAFEYCDTSQSFGVQTFAIWVIAVVWLVAPYIFNTDGLDWEKTKADVATWAKWMYATEDYVDKDQVMVGGWIGWWKGELKAYHNSKPIARLTVLFRECRHFVLMWYVVALEWEILTVGLVFAFAVVTILAMGLFGTVNGTMRNIKATVRAIMYTCTVTMAVIIYFVIAMAIFDLSFTRAISLFFGYMAALYGLNEMARMYSFASSSIATVGMFQQLAFFFDFVFSVSMIIPLLIMSAVPFLNIVQTRMMYNKGFSEVVSASSQYAFSLAAFMGMLGGIGCGWMFHLFTSLESTAGFLSYATTYSLLDGNVGDGTVTYAFYFANIFGTFLAGVLNHFIGRRLTIVLGGLLTVSGMLGVSAVQSAGEALLLPGICLLGSSVGVLMPTLAVYIYEISTRDMRGKALLLLGCGFILGILFAAWFSSSSDEVGWVWQVFIATIILSIMTPAVYIFPESPYWVYMRKGLESCERCLTILRRKESVYEELRMIRDEEAGSDDSSASGGTLFLKFLVGLMLMLVSSIFLGCVNMYMSNTFRSMEDATYTFVNCMAMQLLGALFSFFFMDRIDHKRILFCTLLPMAVLAVVLGLNDHSPFFSGHNEFVLLQILGLLIYFFAGLGITSVPWVSCVGLFKTSQRAVSVTGYFMVFFLLPVCATYIRSNEAGNGGPYLYLFALSGCCVAAIGILFTTGTLKNGMVCTKGEMEAERTRLRRIRASRRSARTPGSARSRNLSRSRVKSHSNYQMYDSPSGSAP